MKKNLFVGLIALTALTVTSCTNDEVVEAIPQKQAIEFGTYLGRDAQSRGTELANANLLNFGVFASYTNESNWVNTIPNFMFNQKVSRTNTSSNWEYNPKKYWPTNKGDKISFWAYAPYAESNCLTVESTKEATTTPIITYTINKDNLLTQVDFVTDVEMNVQKEATTDPDSENRTINLGLRHELTRVGITAKLDKTIAAETKVNIKKIEFGGADFATVAKYTFAQTSNARGTWTPTTKGSALDISNIMNIVAPSDLDGYTTNGVFLTSNSGETIFKGSQYLFLIPFANGITTEKVTITVYYDIVTKDTALKDGHSCTPATKIITLPSEANLLMPGKAYNFNLTFYMNEITLNASVEEGWGDSIDNDHFVDWNDVDPNDPS